MKVGNDYPVSQKYENQKYGQEIKFQSEIQ